MKWIDNPYLSHVGKVSYGIYLLHSVVIHLSRNFLTGNNALPTFLVSAPASIVLATLVYESFERPILRLKERFR